MHYKNGQAGNMQEVELTENTDELKTRLETPNAKFYEFSLKSTERNVLQNDFALSMEYSFFSHPDSFSSNFRIEVSFYFFKYQKQSIPNRYFY